MPVHSMDSIMKKVSFPSFIKSEYIIDLCAEGVVIKTTYLSRECVTKIRITKPYRVKILDIKLRKKRTLQEAKIIVSARLAGVNTPVILDLDVYNMSITMTYIEGYPIKEVFSKHPSNYERYFEVFGEEVSKLHHAGIIHGDLTTSNVLVENSSNQLFFIDFGLGKFSKNIEDKATDLMVLKRTLESTHSNYWKQAWNAFVNGYRKTFSAQAKTVLKRVEKIELRGRHSRKDS